MSTDFLHDLDQLRAKYSKQIEETLYTCLGEKGYTKTMIEYHLYTGGKRLRPLLLLMLLDSLKVSPERGIRFSAAIEMLHNATLVHDDLQDGDVVRRSQPTIWKKYGEAQAINVGDMMFFHGIQLTLSAVPESDINLRLVEWVSYFLKQVIEGQALELQLKGDEHITLERYFEVILGKTSGLFSLPLVGAAVLANLTARNIHILEELGNHLGVAFQIQDDLIDLYGNKERDQKGSDIAEGKISFLVAHYLQNCTGSQLYHQVKEIINKPRQNTSMEDISLVSQTFLESGQLEAALMEIQVRKQMIQQSLMNSELPTTTQDMLANFIDWILSPSEGIRR